MKQAYMKYLSALLLFGSNGIVASHISLSSFEIVYLRTLIGSIFLITIFLLSGRKITFFHHKKDCIFLLLSGISMGCSWIFLYEAYTQIGVSIASLIYYCGPIIVMLLSPILFKEKLSFGKLLGFVCVLIGLVLVNETITQTTDSSRGLLCGIASAVMYALMVIFNKKTLFIKGLENATLQLMISFFTVAIFVSFKQSLFIHIPSKSLLPIFFLGLINTGLGCYLYFSSLSKIPVQTISICGYLEPLSAVCLSAFFLNERLSYIQIIGTGLILGGAIYAELKQ